MTSEERMNYIRKIVNCSFRNELDEGMVAFIQFANNFSNEFAETFMPYSIFELPAIIAGLELLSKSLRDTDSSASDMADAIISNTKVALFVDKDGKTETYFDGNKVKGSTIFEGKL